MAFRKKNILELERSSVEAYKTQEKRQQIPVRAHPLKQQKMGKLNEQNDQNQGEKGG